MERPTTRQTLAQNLRFLMDLKEWSEAELARRSGVSQKAINNTLNMRNSTQIETAESLAKPFGLEGWHLLLPNLIPDVQRGGTLTKLITNYLNSSDEGQSLIAGIAEREAKYNAR